MKLIKRLLIIGISLGILGFTVYLGINIWMHTSTKNYVIDADDESIKADTIMVLGAYVYSDGRLSDMLEDRMIYGLKAYENNMADTLLLSGDHGQKSYDEVNSMRIYAEENGVPSSQVFMDHAGFSTYESMVRAKEIFDVKRMVIVTQRYHLTRAVYIARQLGIEAYGIASDRYIYPKMPYYKLRESVARVKDFMYVNIIKPDPTYLGDTIPISGDGKLTHDQQK